MRRMIWLATCTALLCFSAMFPIDPQHYVQAQQISLGGLDVTDYGANGADEADDTIAFQACATELIARTVKIMPQGGSGEAAFPLVTIPAGVYNLSGPINWGGYAWIRAAGSVVIKSPEGVDAFLFPTGYMVRLDGITFLGGQTSVRFTNANVNGGRLHLSHCRFQSTTDSSIVAAPLVPPFFSSHVTIDHCKWFNCRKAVTTWADINTMSNSWLQWGEAVCPQNTCCIEVLGGRFNIADSLFVPVFPGGALGRRWIGWWGFPQRNGGSGIFADRTRFGGEHGGLPPIAIHTPPDLLYPFQGPSVTLRGCQLSCGQTSWPDTAVINCNGGLPQTVYLDACTNVIGPCPLMRDQSGTTEAILAQLQNANGRIRIVIGANCFYPLNPPVPLFLTQYVRNLAL